MIRQANLYALALLLILTRGVRAADSLARLEVHGFEVIPHARSSVMQYRRPSEPELGVLVRLFLRNASTSPIPIDDALPVHLRGLTPSQLLTNGDWTWHDTPAAWPGVKLSLPPGTLTVWSFNTRGTNWGIGTRAKLNVGHASGSAASEFDLPLDEPKAWLSAVPFFGPTNSFQPDSLIFHVANESRVPLRIVLCRLRLPASSETSQVLLPREPNTRTECFPSDRIIPAKDRGGARVVTGKLPLVYATIEIQFANPGGQAVTLWSHLRAKRERIAARRSALIAEGSSYGLDPGNSPTDLAVLKQVLVPGAK